eukprot:Skav209828  [mRNA]  locus=scaffold2703:54694:55458:+ [translate_table: standard]
MPRLPCAVLMKIAIATFAAEWSRFKQRWAATHGGLTCAQALAAARKIAAEALCQEHATSAYHTVGIDCGASLNINKLLVERKHELSTSLKSNAAEVPKLSSASKRTFEAVAAIGPPKTKCPKCTGKIDVVGKWCRHCGEENAAFDEALSAIHKSRRQSNWTANADWLATKTTNNCRRTGLVLEDRRFFEKIWLRKKQPELPPMEVDGQAAVPPKDGPAASSCPGARGRLPLLQLKSLLWQLLFQMGLVLMTSMF